MSTATTHGFAAGPVTSGHQTWRTRAGSDAPWIHAGQQCEWFMPSCTGKIPLGTTHLHGITRTVTVIGPIPFESSLVRVRELNGAVHRAPVEWLRPLT